jgi:sec-independent protein translocase protein TatB
MFNLSGSEIVFLLLIALIVLGPEKLPEAVRKFGKVYAEIKKMSTGFQSELRSALDEPMREMRETAEAIKQAADFNFLGDSEVEPEESPAGQESAAVDEPTALPAADPVKGNGTHDAHTDIVEPVDENAAE